MLLLALGGPAPALARWSAPTRITAPVAADLLPARVAAGPGRRLAVGYGSEDADNPQGSQGLLSWRDSAGPFGPPLALAGTQAALAVAYRGSDLIALGGESPPPYACCSSVTALGPVRQGSAGGRQVLVGGLAGPVDARLLNARGGLVAVVASGTGVWAARTAGPGMRFRPARLLSGSRQLPQEMDAAVAAGGATLIAWAPRVQFATAGGPRQIYLTRARTRALPPPPRRPILTVPAGHAVDELGLAAAGRQPLLVWTESWFDRRGGYHSVVREAEVGRRGRLRSVALSGGGELGTGLAVAGQAGGGATAVAWKSCARSGACTVQALRFDRNGHVVARTGLGGIDAGQTPVAAVTARGQAVVAFVRAGHVLAASGSRGFGPGALVSGTRFASDLTVVPAGGGAAAVWTQGTLQQSLMLAELR